MYCLIPILLTIPSAITQFAFNSMKADVTFDDRNDRYDLSNIIRNQNKFYRPETLDRQSSDENDYRRFGEQNVDYRRSNSKYKPSDYSARKSKSVSRSRKKLLMEIKKARQEQLNRILNDALLRIHMNRRSNDFAYHDEMISNSDNEEDFNTNLDRFKANVKESSGKFEDIGDILSNLVTKGRRSMPDEKVLMHYAVPVNMRVEGFLQNPSE